ncbi:hypothetical protein SVIOM74S_05467 [Streptomyces violarus]
MACPRRLAWVPSPGSLTMNGYTSGSSPSTASGAHPALSPSPLPGSHSIVPCLPMCTIASAPKLFSSQR